MLSSSRLKMGKDYDIVNRKQIDLIKNSKI